MIQLMTYHTERGQRCALVDDRGYKFLRVLYLDSSGLRVRKVPKDHTRYMSEVRQCRKLPGLATVARRFRAYGNKVGMTKEAKQFLTLAAKQETTT